MTPLDPTEYFPAVVVSWSVPMKVLKRCCRVVMACLSVALYASLAPVGYLGFIALSQVPARSPQLRAYRLQGIMRRAFALMHHWLRWVRVLDYDPRRLEGRIPDGPCIVISNHPALDDVTTVMSTIPRLCTAVNRRTYNRRWLRPLLEGAGQFSGGIHNLLGSQAVLDSAAERIQQGFRVLVFPEGARSPRGQLRPFARGAFEVACRLGIPIQPVLIRADPLWLARGDSVLLPTADLPRKRVRVLDPLHPADFGGDSRAMRDHAEAMYSGILEAPVARRPNVSPAPVAQSEPRIGEAQ